MGIWVHFASLSDSQLFPSLYIAYLNRYGATLLRGELGPNEEENAKQIESLLYGLDEEEWETLLLESVSLSSQMTTEEVAVLEEMEEEVLFEYNRKRRETGIVKCIQSIPGYEWMYDLALICDV